MLHPQSLLTPKAKKFVHSSRGSHLVFFHVVQHFTKNNSFVKVIFKNRVLAVSKSEMTGNNTAFHAHICLAHHCEMNEQRNKVCQLLLALWQSIGEEKAADLLCESHCKEPHCDWNR